VAVHLVPEHIQETAEVTVVLEVTVAQLPEVAVVVLEDIVVMEVLVDGVPVVAPDTR